MVKEQSKQGFCKETARSRYWRGRMAAWERSGLTQAEFCRRKGLSRAAFGWWRHRFKKARWEEEIGARTSADRDSGTRRRKRSAGRTEGNGRRNREKESGEPAPLFIPIEVKSGVVQDKSGVAEESSGDRIEVMLASGHRLRVPNGFHSETLVRLVEILEGSC